MPKEDSAASNKFFSKLTIWAQFLASIAAILAFLFAIYQTIVALRKDKNAERALDLAIQSSNLVNQAKINLEYLAEKQKKLADLTQISTLSIQAENGDRASLAALFDLVPDSTNMSLLYSGPVSSAKKGLDRIAYKFNNVKFDDPVFRGQIGSFTSSGVTEESIKSHLTHTNYIIRARAAYNVSFLRVNKVIPLLYERACAEPDLHVLSIISYSLNLLLAPDKNQKPFFTTQFVFDPEWAEREFTNLWLSAKDELLAQSAKKWISIEPTPDMPWNSILIDPDTQDEKTGLPKGPKDE